MPNAVVGDWLVTDKSTPLVAKWLQELFGSLSPPEGSIHMVRKQSAIRELTMALEYYKQHRQREDSERRSSQQNLLKVVNNWLASARLLASHVRDRIPTTEEQFAEAFQALNTLQKWRFACDRCSRETYGIKSLTHRGQTLRYCGQCFPVMAIHCLCGEDHFREDYDLRYARNNDTHSESCACQKVPEAEFETCSVCHNWFLGQPARPEGITTAELRKHNYHLCYHCAERVRKYDCGHIDTGGATVHDIAHVEDDNRAREEVHADSKAVCRTCARSRPRLAFWDATQNIKARSFEEVGSQRRYGVELEVCQVSDLSHPPKLLTNYWHCKADASLPSCGAEFASVILQGDEGLGIIRDFCEYARGEQYAEQRGQAWSVDTRSGFHLHVDVYDDSWQAKKAIAIGYLATYDLWRSFVAPSRGRCKYCRQHGLKLPNALKLSGELLVDRLSNESDNSTERRRRWCNWCCYEKYGTVEIRLHQGTLAAEKVVRWVQAHTRFIDWCASQEPEEVAQALSGNVRQQFLTLSAGPWGRELGRWLKKRALLLHNGCGPLKKSKHQARTYTILGQPCQVAQTAVTQWMIQRVDIPGYYLRHDMRFGRDSGLTFSSQQDAESIASLAERDEYGASLQMSRLAVNYMRQARLTSTATPITNTINF